MHSHHLVTIRLGLHDLLHHRRLSLVMSMVIAVSLSVFAILVVYRAGLAAEFSNLSPELLVVQESDSFGEIYGSRLSSQVGERLKSMGVSLIVPQIHEVTGTSVQEATMIRGVDLERFALVERFSLLSGRALAPGAPSRAAMIGTRLADTHSWGLGSRATLRGRDFNIVGIFHTGTYRDNEAWISLEDAQALLGWEEQVSIFVIPDEGILSEGDTLPGGISISRKGESALQVTVQYQPIIDLMGFVAATLGVATALSITNVVWRLAWLRRREMAILRTAGFPATTLAGYLLTQAGGLTLAGVVFGGLFTLGVTSVVQLGAFGLTINPRLDTSAALLGLGWIAAITLAGSILPIWWMGRFNLAQLLNAE